MTVSRDYPPRPILAASTAVFRDGRVLLGSRRRAPREGVFSLPGGVVELGETLEQAALRELREETGVEAVLVGFNAHAELIQRDDAGRVKRHYVIASFAARWISGEGEPSREFDRLIWANGQDLADLPTTPGLTAVLERARRMVAP